MPKAIVDIVLLLFLILFFALQKRSQRPLYFHYWLVGWCAGIIGFSASVLPLFGWQSMGLHEAMRWDPILLGAICFALSFEIKSTGALELWLPIVLGIVLCVPCDILILFDPPGLILRWLCVLMFVAAHLVALIIIFDTKSRKTPRSSIVICIVATAFVAIEAAGVLLKPSTELPDWISAEVYICAAISFALYGTSRGRRSLASLLGVMGFCLWASFCLMHYFMLDTSKTLQTIYAIWAVPKYCVAFSMILITFEEAALEKNSLIKHVHTLYEDFKLIYEKHPYPMWIVDKQKERFVSLNKTALRIYGLKGETWETVHPTELEMPVNDEDNDIVRQHEVSAGNIIRKHRYASGNPGWVNLVEHEIMFHGQQAKLIIARDVTEQIEANRRLAHRANHDALTGLPNRHLFDLRLAQCLESCRLKSGNAALLTVDIDHFKFINDTYGHPVGDECLQLVARRLLGQLRAVDMVARVGGEEFCIILEEMHNIDDLDTITDSLLGAFESPLHLSEYDVAITVSIGTAIYPHDGVDANILKKQSDRALYGAKTGGRNRAVSASSLPGTLTLAND